MPARESDITLQVGGRDVVVSHPSRLLIPSAKVSKLDLVRYYVAIADGALRGAGGRPCVLVRYPNGIDGAFFFQKRAPAKRPDALDVVSLAFPSGRSAEERRWQAIGDPHAGIDAHAGSLESLLALSARHEAEGHGDAPWPPHEPKAAGEPERRPPSAARERAPLIVVARADRESEALAAADAWKAAHPDAAAHLEAADVLIDRMRGKSSLWYRVRINLTRVPVRLRPKATKPS